MRILTFSHMNFDDTLYSNGSLKFLRLILSIFAPTKKSVILGPSSQKNLAIPIVMFAFDLHNDITALLSWLKPFTRSCYSTPISLNDFLSLIKGFYRVLFLLYSSSWWWREARKYRKRFFGFSGSEVIFEFFVNLKDFFFCPAISNLRFLMLGEYFPPKKSLEKNLPFGLFYNVGPRFSIFLKL